jgi:hypothetical protein
MAAAISSPPALPGVGNTVVLYHVLPNVAFRELMEMRCVSRSMRALATAQLLAWMRTHLGRAVNDASIADAVWLLQQLRDWCWLTETTFLRSSLETMRVDAFDCDVLYSRFAFLPNGEVFLLRRLRQALAEHDSACGYRMWKQRSPANLTRLRTLRSYARDQRRTRLVQALMAVRLFPDEVTDKETGRYNFGNGGLTLWWEDGRWRGESRRRGHYARAHDLVNANCDGQCGWGGCGESTEPAVRSRRSQLSAVPSARVFVQWWMR